MRERTVVTPVLNVLSLILVAAKRLFSNFGLTLCLVAGLAAAVALSTGIPIYSDAVNTKMLKEELERGGKPPFGMMVRHIGSWYEPLTWDEYADLNDYMVEQAPGLIELPLELSVRHVETASYRLFPVDETHYEDTKKTLDWVSLGFMTDAENNIDVIEGELPETPGRDDEVIGVLAARALAEKVGLQLGEEFVLFGEETSKNTGQKTQIKIRVRISGIWVPTDEESPYWFYTPWAFAKMFLISEESYKGYVVPRLQSQVMNAVWYAIYDGGNVMIEDIPGFLYRLTKMKTSIAAIVPDARLDQSPEKPMAKYRLAAYHLAILLYVFSIPVLGLVLYFISLIAGMVVDRQRNEIALLRSRGTSGLQIVSIYVLEGLLAGLAAIFLGTMLGAALARLMANTESLLKFTFGTPLPIRISALSLRFGLITVALSLLASLFPAISASRHTIVTYKRERARHLGKPFWQRYFLDFFLLAPLLYGYYALWRRGTMAAISTGETLDSPFRNPILFLVPTLFVFTTALIYLRFFPYFMEKLASLLERSRGAPLVLAARSLARSSRYYTGPLLLVILTIGLASFTASMARTLDDHMVDDAYYRSGSDFNVYEVGEYVGDDSVGDQAADTGASDEGGAGEIEEPHWEFLPHFTYLNIPGVKALTRVGDYKVRILWSDTVDEGHIIGIDRDNFADIAFFRDDFAAFPLSKIIQALRMRDPAVFVDSTFLRQNQLQLGSRMLLSVSMLGKWHAMEFFIAGTIDYFPTSYPDKGPLFVTNLEYLFSQAGGLYSYHLWLKTDSSMSTRALEIGLMSQGTTASMVQHNAREEILASQRLPERQGFFGLLSVGFIAAALLTALGYLIYSLIHFQRRSIELGVLRAIGLSIKQMILYLVSEQLSLVVIGSGTGVLLGAATSVLFIPFLQVSSGKNIGTPPFIVRIAWADISQIVIMFGLLLIAVSVIMVWLLIRMKIFQAVKLEEVT